MGKGGFTVVRDNSNLTVNSDTDWFSDFELPDDYPDNIMAFLHLDFNLSAGAKIFVVRGGTAFVINNDETITGSGFRSFAIQKNETFNIQSSVGQAGAQFILALEG